MKKRLIVVGAGSIGIRHAQIASELPNLTVELCDPSPEGLREASGIVKAARCWTSFEEAVASRPDFMIVATPHRLHSAMACAAMEGGIDVLCEKPLSDTAAGSERVAECARRTGRNLQVGFMLRFHPAILRLRALWEEGVLGNVLSIRYAVGAYETLENSRSRHQQSVPGALVMDYVHGLDLILWLTKATPVGIYARGLTGGDFPLTSQPNLVSAIVDLSPPMLAEVHIDYMAKPFYHDFEAVGDRGSARLDFVRGTLEIRRLRENRTDTEFHSVERNQLFRDQLKGFLGEAAERHRIACTAMEGVASTRLMEGMIHALNDDSRRPAFS